ncbi:response regulator transcription factor [Anaerolineales bacterium HSG6]|nr:response regulator transcription factor [Anaerolineales bacterium HSG6]MDM8531689.1 response regulator transcription factor [Anaerolineales bacterium HSG25]
MYLPPRYSILSILNYLMRVLLADDRSQVRSALRFLLEQETNLQVVGEAINATGLLQQLQTSQPDLVLLDWELPGMPITNLLTALRQQTPQVQIVVLSSRLEARPAALAAGIEMFISKGNPPEQLLSILQTMRRQKKNTSCGR